MNGDIRPPQRPVSRSDFPIPQAQQPPASQQPEPPLGSPSGQQDQASSLPPPVNDQQSLQPAAWTSPASTNQAEPTVTGDMPKKPRRRWPWAVGIVIGALVAVAVLGGLWYSRALSPVSSGPTEYKEVSIASGSTPRNIASQLHQEGLIRSEQAFMIHTRIQGVQGDLQAGDYRLAPAYSTPEVVSQLLAGKAAHFTITFYPGATLYDPTDIEDSRRTDVYTMLRRAGYGDAGVRAALDRSYDHPIFAGKPADASLEGYVFGETYQFDTAASVEQVLEHAFDVFYERIQAADIIDRLDDHDMSLYQAITLASVIEREVSGLLEDQRGVSQIFHTRLEVGEPLGADATFMYAAQQRNVTPTINIDSPYNTRVNKGLPPGPIAVPDIVALEAAVDPADTDWLFFVSGDDGKTHFARTNAEHEENTRRYCTTLCTDIAQ